jgi:hypothetical protein
MLEDKIEEMKNSSIDTILQGQAQGIAPTKINTTIDLNI